MYIEGHPSTFSNQPTRELLESQAKEHRVEHGLISRRDTEGKQEQLSANFLAGPMPIRSSIQPQHGSEQSDRVRTNNTFKSEGVFDRASDCEDRTSTGIVEVGLVAAFNETTELRSGAFHLLI